jgi:HK97 family phage portal protein
MTSFLRRLLQPRAIMTSAGLAEYLRHGAQTYAGMSVTPDTAVQVSAVFACARVVAEDLAKLPVVVYQRSDREEKERAPNSPFWRLLHDKPNSWQSSQQFREYLTLCAILRGNGFAWKNVLAGQVRELLPIHPARVRIEQLPDYEIVYHVRDDRGIETPYTRRQIFHLSGPSLDGVSGVSIVGLARQSIGLAMAAEGFGATLFGNSAMPRGVLEHPGKLSKEASERLRESWHEVHQGVGSANKVAVLQEGMKFHQIGLSNEDSQFLETRQFSIVDIARWFRVPPHKIGELGRATWGNIEHMAIEYVTDTLMSWGRRWEDAFNQQVIGTNNVYAELLFDALLRGSTMDRYQAYQIAAGGNAPWMTRNEIRRLENRPPLDGLDEILKPLNMGAGAAAGSGDDAADEPATT